MNKEMTNSIYRLETMITLLGGDGATINRLAQLMDISKNVIYDDLLSIANDKNSRLMILTYDEDYEDDFVERTPFVNEIKSGKYDDVEIFISTPYENKIELVLSSEEIEVLQDFTDKRLDKSHSRGQSYLIKNSNSGFSERDIELSNFISETMEDGSSLVIRYKSPKEGEEEFTRTIRPVRIVHNTEDNLVYVCDQEGHFYRFDNIRDYKPSSEVLEISPELDMKKFDKMWGVNISEDYIHIKLKIFDEVGTIDRVKKDLGKKVSKDTFVYYPEKGYAIYEDDIVGVGSFMSWLYSYGSSVVLLEPKELVDRVVSSIKMRKDMYR